MDYANDMRRRLKGRLAVIRARRKRELRMEFILAAGGVLHVDILAAVLAWFLVKG